MTMTPALGDVLVLDLSHALAGPFASTMLGDYGAEVIKIEPLDGDIARAWGPPFYGDEAAYFALYNSMKQYSLISQGGYDASFRLRVGQTVAEKTKGSNQ